MSFGKVRYRWMIVLALLMANSACARQPVQCSNDWHVTGYYTPVEDDFRGKARHTIYVNEQGKYRFNRQFIEQVKLEGWGRTRQGWYLGYYSGQWHKSSAPRDANGNILSVGSVATDPDMIALGRTVIIPGLYPHLKRKRFVARDVGRSIRLRRIDVYTGEGNAAKKMSYQLTRRDHRVCM